MSGGLGTFEHVLLPLVCSDAFVCPHKSNVVRS